LDDINNSRPNGENPRCPEQDHTGDSLTCPFIGIFFCQFKIEATRHDKSNLNDKFLRKTLTAVKKLEPKTLTATWTVGIKSPTSIAL
jgi:hypothetical protein